VKISYPACFYKNEETGFYVVIVPDLPGCVTGGNTLANAILMGVDAASGWVLDELEDGHPVPAPTPMEDVLPEPGGFVSLLALDIAEYAKKFGSEPIVINMTFEIPAYLNTFVESQRFDFSKLVQDSIAERYQRCVFD